MNLGSHQKTMQGYRPSLHSLVRSANFYRHLLCTRSCSFIPQRFNEHLLHGRSGEQDRLDLCSPRVGSPRHPCLVVRAD